MAGSGRRERVAAMGETIFVLTFNTNSCEVSEATLAACFEDAHGAAAVVCSFQEYDAPPDAPLPADRPPAVYTGFSAEEEVKAAAMKAAKLRGRGGGGSGSGTGSSSNLAKRRCVPLSPLAETRSRGSSLSSETVPSAAAAAAAASSSYLRTWPSAEAAAAAGFKSTNSAGDEDADRIVILQQAVDGTLSSSATSASSFSSSSSSSSSASSSSPRYELVVDCAMGEPAGKVKLPNEDPSKKAVEWYGFIRLMVWVRPDTALGAALSSPPPSTDSNADVSDAPPSVAVAVIPTGSKASSLQALPAPALLFGGGHSGSGAGPSSDDAPPLTRHRSPTAVDSRGRVLLRSSSSSVSDTYRDDEAPPPQSPLPGAPPSPPPSPGPASPASTDSSAGTSSPTKASAFFRPTELNLNPNSNPKPRSEGEGAPAVVVVEESVEFEAAYENYDEQCCPDKGAVVAFFPRARLAVVAAHLYGTNAHGVPECKFDAYRFQQLARIHRGTARLVRAYSGGGGRGVGGEDLDSAGGGGGGGGGGAGPLPLSSPSSSSSSSSSSATPLLPEDVSVVLAGDLNFRVEASAAAEDKAKGGRDWALVEAAASDTAPGWESRLAAMFREHERLGKHILAASSADSSSSSSSSSSAAAAAAHELFLRGMVDPVALAVLQAGDDGGGSVRGGVDGAILPHGGFPPRPTFTKEITGAPPPRPAYGKKRTPSWTDRVLLRGALFRPTGGAASSNADAVLSCRSLPHVVSSDHEPVAVLIACGGACGDCGEGADEDSKEGRQRTVTARVLGVVVVAAAVATVAAIALRRSRV